MKSSVEPQEGNLVKLSVTVPASDVDKAIADAYGATAKKVRIPGFRLGKAPRKVIDTYMGRENVLADAQQVVVESSYEQALKDNEVRPIDQPDFGEMDGLVEGEDYTFVATIPIRPELGLTGDWQHMSVTVPPRLDVEEQVGTELERLREQYATLEPVEDRGVADGDFVLLSFVGDVGGEAFEGNKVDDYLYEMGRGDMPSEFDEQLKGAKAGDHVTVTFTIPDTSTREDFVGKPATFEVDVQEIKSRQLPAVDDELAQNAGYENIDELREYLRARVESGREFTYNQNVERAVKEAIATHLDGDVPEQLSRARRDNMIREFFGSLEERGISLQEYMKNAGADLERITTDIEKEAQARVTQEFALEALSRAEGLGVTDEDIDQELAGIRGESSEQTLAQMRAEWEEAGVLPVLREAALQRKAMAWLRENVTIVEAEPETEASSPEAEKPKKTRKSAKKKEE